MYDKMKLSLVVVSQILGS